MDKNKIIEVLENPHDYCDEIIAETIMEVIEIFKTCQIVRKPKYDCSCYMTYPNKQHRKSSGKWKCVDEMTPIKHHLKREGVFPCTKCVKRDRNEVV